MSFSAIIVVYVIYSTLLQRKVLKFVASVVCSLMNLFTCQFFFVPAKANMSSCSENGIVTLLLFTETSSKMHFTREVEPFSKNKMAKGFL